MNDDADKIVSLLAEIRDNQKEAIALQKIAVLRQKRAVRIQIVGLAVIVPYLIYVAFKFFDFLMEPHVDH